MNLREWKSNSNKLNQIFKEDEMKGENVRVLGLNWDTVEDTIEIPTEKFNGLTLANTKRQVLAPIATLFDPLGYF